LYSVRYKYLFFFLIFLPSIIFAQQWKRYRREHVYHVGATNFLGDLGGANQIGTHFVKDFEVLATRPVAGFCYRYRLDARQYVRYSAFAGLLKGNDNLTKEQFRNNRNLQFRSPILELSAQYEFSITKDKTGHRYNIRSAKGIRGVHFQVYLFLGAGISGFYPFGPYPKGGWVALRPLRTEGQGMPDGPIRQYWPVTIVIPYGVGYKHPISRLMSIGVEAGVRYTFSDYLDDVSTNYYDPVLLKQKYGNVAAIMSNPPNNSNPSWTAPGQQRGDPKHKDVYMFLSVNLSRKLAPKRTKAKF
jgi:Domain of unknown function (DUF6089)